LFGGFGDKTMKDIKEIEEACDRAADLQNEARDNGSKYRGMTYEDGLRDALDWVCENTDEDPTE
jgi:hypothetical protein